MPPLTSLLYQLKTESQHNGWSHVEESCSELINSLEELNYQSPKSSKPPEQLPTLEEMYAMTFPPLQPSLEALVGDLKFKFEVEHIDHVPTLYIHSKKAISEEEFGEIILELEDVAHETISFNLENPFMIVETHTYCVNLIEHCTLIYGVLHNALYGGYDNPEDDQWELPGVTR